MEKISWTDRVRIEEVLQRVKEKWNVIYTIARWEFSLIDHVLHMNCFLKYIEGKIGGRIEVTGRRGRKCKQLLEDLQEEGGYWKLKEESLNRNTGERAPE